MKRLLQIITVLLLAVTAPATHAQTVMFDYASAWKYLDNGTDQGTGWTATTFNDATWASDTGFFGYGDTWITRCVNACGTVSCSPTCGTKYITTYFRKTINIPSLAIYDSMRLNIKRDDGIVVYVNGVEVWRDNMPTGTITYTSAAPVALGGVDEYTPITRTIPISYFATGNNTIAVEVHQQSGTSSDLGFNMQMISVPSRVFFDFTDTWKYFTTATDPGTSWIAPAFNDASWTTASGHIGFGETWTTTCIPAGAACAPLPSCNLTGSCTKYTTTYFRKAVTIPSTTLYDSMKFTVFRDDGLIMYVNGVEVWRDNMPTGAVTYATFAPNNITGTTGVYAESLAVVKSIPISAFSNGTNVIAVELHQNSATSSDLDFDVKMEGILHATVVTATPVTLSQGPYLQKGSQTAVNVRWRTNIASRSNVTLGTVLGIYPIIASDTNRVTEHEVRVTGLTQDTKYYYRFGTDTSIIQGDSTNFFVTAPADTSTRRVTIAAFGDCGRNDNSFQTGSLSSYQNYLATQNMKAADLMLLIGDNAYDAGTDVEFSNNFFSRYSSNVLKNHMLFPCPGNHDYANDATRQVDHNVPYYNLFSLPSAGECGGVPSGTEAYYSYNWGNVHFLSLDSYGEENSGTTRLYDTAGAQVSWIKSDLAANNKKWVIAYWHHPPYTMGSHTSDGEAELVNIRQNFIRILERYGVDVIICGHSHDYERSYLLKGHYGNEASFNKATHCADSSSGKYDGTANSCPYTTPSGKVNHGTVYVVSGSAGADGGVQSGYPHDALPFSVDDGGMFYLEVKDNRLDAKFLRRDNSIADKFTIMKDVKVKDTMTVLPGTPVALNASWLGTYAWNTGATTRTVTVTPPADTLITVKDNNTATCLADQHLVKVFCTDLYTVTGGGSLCAGGTGVAIGLSGSTAGSSYRLYNGASPVGTAVVGTGAAITFGPQAAAGTYTVVATLISAGCTRTMSGSATVSVNALPVAYTVTGGGNYCSGGTGVHIGLSGSAGGISYRVYMGGSPVGTATAGTGAMLDMGLFTAAGTYTVVATNTATTCTGNMTSSATIGINALPATHSVTGGGAYCSGGTGMHVGLGVSDAGINYQLYNGATLVGTPLAGTGLALDFGAQTTAGSYTVTATDAATFCVAGMTGAAAVSIDPLPAAYALTGGGSYCSGGTGVHVGMAGSATGISYQLYQDGLLSGSPLSGTGSTLDFGLYTTAATYTVFATNTATLCTATMPGSAVVSVNGLPAVYTVSGGGHFCAGGTGVAVNIGSSATGISYQLQRTASPVGTLLPGSGSSMSFGPQAIPGIYTVTASNDITHCTSNMSGSASVIADALPVAFTITGGGRYCAGSGGSRLGLSGSGSGIRYQLFKDAAPYGSAFTGTGSPLDLGAYTDTGYYTIVAADLTTACVNTMTGGTAIHMNTLPAAYSVTGGGSLCAGSAGVPVGISSSAIGISYQLYNGTTPMGALMPGSGSSFSLGLQTTAGAYTILASDDNTYCTATMTGSAILTVNPVPVAYTITGGGHYCAGAPGVHVGLSSSASGITYQLYKDALLSGSSAAGTGAALDLGLQTDAAVYTVIATNTGTGCAATMPGSVSVAIDPLPVLQVVTGGGNYCAGGTGVHMGTSSSVTGTNYGLWNGTAFIGTSISGTGSSVDFGLTTLAGTYTVIASDAISHCTRTMTGSTTIAIDPVVTPAVSFAALPATNVCQGTMVTFAAAAVHGGTTPAYRWSINGVIAGTDSTGYTYLPANGDVVKLKLTSNVACATVDSAVTTLTMTVNTNQMPAATIAATPAGAVCVGEPVTFTVSSVYGGTTPAYRWLINGLPVGAGTTYTTTLANGDDVQSMLTSNFTCRLATTVSSNTVHMTVNPLLTPSVSVTARPLIIPAPGRNDTLTATVTGGGSSIAYQWMVNAIPVAGATNAVFISHDLQNNDNVTCRVTATNDCGDALATATVHITISTTGITTLVGNDDVVVIPNPSNGEFALRGTIGSGTGDIDITVLNMTGQVVYTEQVATTNGDIDHHISLSSTLARGAYIIRLRSGAAIKMLRITVDK